MHNRAYCVADSAEDTCPVSGRKVLRTADIACTEHVVDDLVDTFHDGVGLRIARGNELALDNIVVM